MNHDENSDGMTGIEPFVTDRQWLYQVIARFKAAEASRLIDISRAAASKAARNARERQLNNKEGDDHGTTDSA